MSHAIDYCNMSRLWKDVSRTQPATIISEYSQDLVCLLSDVADADVVTVQGTGDCCQSLGLLKINHPKGEANSVNFTADKLTSINNLVAGPNSYVNIAQSSNISGKAVSVNYISANRGLSISNVDKYNFFSVARVNELSVNNSTGVMREAAANTASFNNATLQSTKLDCGSLTLSNSSVDNCSIESSGAVTINIANNDTQKITASRISGENINYTAPTFDLDLEFSNTATINSAGVLGGKFSTPTSGNPKYKPSVVFQNFQTLTATEYNNIKYLSATTSRPSGLVRGNHTVSESINLEGPTDTEGWIILQEGFFAGAKTGKFKGFANYGTISVIGNLNVSSGVNYGIITCGSINQGAGFVNSGTLTVG